MEIFQGLRLGWLARRGFRKVRIFLEQSCQRREGKTVIGVREIRILLTLNWYDGSSPNLSGISRCWEVVLWC